jgi:hypothetical protein
MVQAAPQWGPTPKKGFFQFCLGMEKDLKSQHRAIKAFSGVEVKRYSIYMSAAVYSCAIGQLNVWKPPNRLMSPAGFKETWPKSS